MNATRCILASICLILTQVNQATAMLPLTCSSSECGQIDPVVSQFQSGKPLEASTQLNGLIDQLETALSMLSRGQPNYG